jgi:hypothetical protein
MRARRACFWIGCLILGCHSLAAKRVEPPIEATSKGFRQDTEKKPDAPVHTEGGKLSQASPDNPAFLGLAADSLDKGNDADAADHLADYVQTHPDHLVIRVHYADLLLRLHRQEEARAEFERSIAAAQAEEFPQLSQIIHCHSQLMEIALAMEDEYSEHLHRGIGLYHLACQCKTLGGDARKLSVEGLLCQAAGELSLAKVQKPGEARPSWYLHDVWKRLKQDRPARRNLLEAKEASPFTFLTAAEGQELQLAWWLEAGCKGPLSLKP